MESNISGELIALLKEALSKAEPYPLDSEEAIIKYDDPRMSDDHPEKDRVTATIALKFMIEHGITID